MSSMTKERCNKVLSLKQVRNIAQQSNIRIKNRTKAALCVEIVKRAHGVARKRSSKKTKKQRREHAQSLKQKLSASAKGRAAYRGMRKAQLIALAKRRGIRTEGLLVAALIAKLAASSE